MLEKTSELDEKERRNLYRNLDRNDYGIDYGIDIVNLPDWRFNIAFFPCSST